MQGPESADLRDQLGSLDEELLCLGCHGHVEFERHVVLEEFFSGNCMQGRGDPRLKDGGNLLRGRTVEHRVTEETILEHHRNDWGYHELTLQQWSEIPEHLLTRQVRDGQYRCVARTRSISVRMPGDGLPARNGSHLLRCFLRLRRVPGAYENGIVVRREPDSQPHSQVSGTTDYGDLQPFC